ncbi:cystathionine beta-synthase [Nonlabens tegetincola]|uniref:cystathionine beta-synthase n=1 Tax=Nonlabens tegetincola TaxID=323273 RepID=UPI000A20712C|nr:cystathionine beta-synthase [Nonlabens tegetincola]ARN71520.1 cystathionine beta-synthase [Nonlabens tegetincola]
MQKESIFSFIQKVLVNMPEGWVKTTTHRLDIYNEALAKTEFLMQFEQLFEKGDASKKSLEELPTAYDYIRLGHPLSCVLEWTLAKINDVDAHQVISFSSRTAPILAVLRKNLLENKNTRLVFNKELPAFIDLEKIREVYGYNFEAIKIESVSALDNYAGSTVHIKQDGNNLSTTLESAADFTITTHGRLGSIISINNDSNKHYIGDIQHVRRRETIAMTPADSLKVLKSLLNNSNLSIPSIDTDFKKKVLKTIQEVAGIDEAPVVGSSGLSIQYAIMMGLIDHANENHPGKPIKFVVPPNCYGGTNDQARRVAATLDHVEIMDLPVDGENDMVNSTEKVLVEIAKQDAIPYIIAEIPTNPRVEVPELDALKKVLLQERKTPTGSVAVDPVFILDQTFCPNIQFMKAGELLENVRSISYASGSKFPSGGKCTAGYCIGNPNAKSLMLKVSEHLNLCDNEATDLQYELLAEQLPGMNDRIKGAYLNTREFVNFIEDTLPEAKINFVSEELAQRGFTPSVFSLDLPTQGNTPEERENYKRNLNLKLIHLMINKIPHESKFCVSYGQLKGCYWTVPATSTQGTTKEEDKDYIVRASLSANMDLELHKQVFKEFVTTHIH